MGLRDDVPHRAAHPTDDWVQPDTGEPQIQPIYIYIPEDIDQGHAPGRVELVSPHEEIYYTQRGPSNAPQLPPPGTSWSQPANSRVPPQGDRVDAARTDRASRLNRTLSNQSETPINLVPDRGAHLRIARPRQHKSAQNASIPNLVDAAITFNCLYDNSLPTSCYTAI
ncbi:MAG: hypothetical protein ACKPKO_27070 [Candidatus Fonsibacter sp.]